MNRLFLFSKLTPNGININGIIRNRYRALHATKPCQLSPRFPKKNTEITKMNENKIQSDLCFLKKSGNEKNIVKRIGEKMKRPTPGENNNPNIGMIIEV